jgi:hypothetical protein
MKLIELFGVKKYHKETFESLVKAFQADTGYKFLGKGYFAYVFKHPTKDEVLKFWIQDTAYEKYIDYCKQNSSPYLPKIYGSVKSLSTFHKRLAGFPEKIKYVRMEYLIELSNNDLKAAHTPKQIIDSMTHFFSRISPEKYLEYTKSGEWDPRAKRLRQVEVDIYWPNGIPSNIIELYETASKLPLAEMERLDLHANNIMVRPSDNHLVLSDPVASDSDIDVMDEINDLISDEAIRASEPRDIISGKASK